MPSNTHIINRQVFEFECLHDEHAFQIRNKFGSDVQHAITGIINRACDELDIGGTDIRIAQMEIDLGRISFEKLEQEIVLKFEKRFFDTLARYKNEQQNTKGILAGKEKSSFEIMQFFLLTGRLPWFAGKQDKNFLNDLFEEVFTRSYDAIRKFIILNLENEKFLERLIGQVSVSRIDQIIQMFGISKDVFVDVQRAISKMIEEIILRIKNGEDKNIWASDLFLQGHENIRKATEITSLLSHFNSRNQNAFFPEIQRLSLLFILKLIISKKDIRSLEIIIESLEKLFEEKFEVGRNVLRPVLLNEQQYFQKLLVAVNEYKEKREAEWLNELDDEDKGLDVDENKFYISNAGLILIAAYLPAFFDQLQLLQSGKFISKNDQVKAIFLLHYLCTGTEDVPEYILPLNKILCGLSLEEPLPSYLLLSDNEKNECIELLNEVIHNWQKVGNSSIEALREAFLNRDGILVYGSNGWKLLIERKGFDVLIDSLPWSFSHIKLSWMQDLITTEW